jgi:hypothetical protein
MMAGLLIFSLILITLHVFSLKAIMKAGNEDVLAESLKKLKDISFVDKKNKGISFNLIFSILIIIVLSLIEIGYFVFVVYILKDHVIIISASVLAGYNVYALIKIFPKLGLFIKNPIEYFKEKTDTFDKFLNFVMAVLEISFCIYVIIKISMNYNFF